MALPEGYDPRRPHPLVIAFHGRTNGNVEVRRYFRLEEGAEEPTVFVYPAGLRDASGRYTWSDPGDPAESPRDAMLFDALLASVERSLCIDRGRVFLVGHSLGASFANTLACLRGNKVRGVFTVGGGITRPKDCAAPVAAMLLHNPRDEQVAMREALRVRNALLAQNGLEPGSAPDEPRRFNCRRYGPDDAENPLLWCPHAQDRTARGRFYPHQWPDGAGDAAMEFLAGLE
ncbi:alpha/beta fold hydrolase [Azospirillum sp. SYSU D00513]|uniref:alpha/beta fold hydrolase n=1 Tax=Azospirillum sp. SYSU D00513 TaxID=2812561 RepID=UPI001A961A45